MSSDTSSSARRQPVWRVVVPSLLGAAFALLAIGIWLPMLHTDKLMKDVEAYSVVSGITELFHSGQLHWAALILFFSILFPAAKLVTLGVVWFKGPEMDLGTGTLTALRLLSKWSMLDIFAVGALVGVVELGILAHATARYGVYVFGGAILLSMIATYLVSWLLEHPKREVEKGVKAKMPVPILFVVFLTGFLLEGAVTRPLMEIEKWVFWENTFSILGGVRELAAQGDTLFALAVLLFVVILPALSLAGWLVLWIGSHAGRRLPKWSEAVLTLDEWAMIDVFALAIVVVVSRVGDLAGVHPRTGMWMMAAAAPLFLLLSWWGRRSVNA